ncbi:MAG TPA: hypothetical protein ENI85_10060 [Deltaproteobacteria bacterium]|nr:hypothetical protein [Deltaproteobacteria bacterium]
MEGKAMVHWRWGIGLAATVLACGMLVGATTAEAGVGGDDAGTCVSACGGYGAGNNANSCYCDSSCTTYGDCCADYQPVCNANTGCAPNSGGRYILHVGGMCSQGWNDAMSSKAGYTSIDVKAVQTNNSGLSDASHTLGIYLDQCCTGSNLCYVINYSGGDAVMGHRFANSGTNWNVNWVGTSAGAGGGSALSGNLLADIFGPCDYSGHLGRSEVRNAYNHNDTNGETVYHIGGYDGWWYTSWLLPGEDDGAVAYHSAGAVTSVTGTSSMCTGPKWTNHVAAWTCTGYDLDHYGMKNKFISNLGW